MIMNFKINHDPRKPHHHVKVSTKSMDEGSEALSRGFFVIKGCCGVVGHPIGRGIYARRICR